MNLPVWRFDDISVNTDMTSLKELIQVIRSYRPDITILLGLSPIVFSPRQFRRYRPSQDQRVHPNELTAMSDIREYYRGDSCGLPEMPIENYIVRAGHGIAHVDHRLLGRKSQELSILMSCSLARASVFIPPYNKYDKNTEAICTANGIELIRFEDGWLHSLYNRYRQEQERWYCHPYDVTVNQLSEWFKR